MMRGGDDRAVEAVAACALAYLLSDRGEYDAARALLAEGLTIECELRSKQGIQRLYTVQATSSCSGSMSVNGGVVLSARSGSFVTRSRTTRR